MTKISTSYEKSTWAKVKEQLIHHCASTDKIKHAVQHTFCALGSFPSHYDSRFWSTSPEITNPLLIKNL
jgi:hypothetical protein